MPDTEPPKVAFSTWKSGQMFSGRANLSLRAVDNVAVDRVEMLVDGQPRTPIVMSPNVTGQDREISDNLFFTGSYTWDTTGLANGPHRVTLRTFDTSGNPADFDLEIKIDHPTISMATPAAITARPGESVKLTYHWSGETVPERAEILTEIVEEPSRRAVARAYHKLPPRPQNYRGDDFAYSQDLDLPRDIARGTYKIAVRMYRTTDGSTPGAPVAIESGPGVAKQGSGPYPRSIIGSLTVVSP
jgi:Bacterial Ig domain